jgi:hypothetical protein
MRWLPQRRWTGPVPPRRICRPRRSEFLERPALDDSDRLSRDFLQHGRARRLVVFFHVDHEQVVVFAVPALYPDAAHAREAQKPASVPAFQLFNVRFPGHARYYSPLRRVQDTSGVRIDASCHADTQRLQHAADVVRDGVVRRAAEEQSHRGVRASLQNDRP